MMSLSDDKQADVIDALINTTSRYLMIFYYFGKIQDTRNFI